MKKNRRQRIQRDDRGRFILSRGPFAKKLVLTDEQANEFQPLLYETRNWRRRILWCALASTVILMVVAFGAVLVVAFATSVVPKLGTPTMVVAIVVLDLVGIAAIQLNLRKQPWYRAYVNLANDLQKNAPTA